MRTDSIGDEFVKNVFKNTRPPTTEEYTQLWIALLNHIAQDAPDD